MQTATCTGAAVLLVSALAFGQANPMARPPRDIQSLSGIWNGSHLEQRQGCRTAQNNGFRGTYSEFRVFVDAGARTISIDEAGITGLSCNWSGQFRDVDAITMASGTLSCTDGRGGTFDLKSFYTTS